VDIIWDWFEGRCLDRQNKNPSRLSRCPEGRRTVDDGRQLEPVVREFPKLSVAGSNPVPRSTKIEFKLPKGLLSV